MRSLNSIEFISNQFTQYNFNDMNLFDVVPTLEKIELGNLQDAFKTISNEEGHTVMTIVPGQKKADMKRYAVILGSSGGIGEAVSRKLAADGWSLYLHYNRNEESASRVANGY